MRLPLTCFLLLAGFYCQAQKEMNYVKEHYIKMDTTITMRDGVKLYTVIYVPKDASQQYPFLLERTPYSAGPYGDTTYPTSIGPNETLMKEQYIFVVQDVRGRYMSEGINLEVTPYLASKKSTKEVDESSDTYDSIDWLLKNIKNNNGRAGIAGISYPGFYATAGLPGAHPALKAVSPQAPVTDEFIGDDANHNGAFFLLDNFSFMNYFGAARKGPVTEYKSQVFKFNTKDAYSFFLNLGPLQNTQSEKYYNHKSYIWNEYLQHDTYDAYWKARNIRRHLNNITIPTLVVGGWFDAEDLFGALHTYEAIEKGSTANNNYLVMGPWTHGAWERKEWKQYGYYDFGSNTSQFFQDSIEATFFNFYLKDKGNFNKTEATVFETGTNQWKNYAVWLPKQSTGIPYFFNSNNKLSLQKNSGNSSYDEYISDPAKPVPYTNGINSRRFDGYMAEDQRFVANRPDVVVFETAELTTDITLAGKIVADLKVSTSGTDADFIVKLIDVLPDMEPNIANPPHGFQMAGCQRLVRAEVMRGKFRDSYEKPAPFVPNKITTVKINLNDVAHTFKKGHRIMVQVQSSWFPLVDRNPQQFLSIPNANENDFKKATIRIYHDALNASSILLPVMQ